MVLDTSLFRFLVFSNAAGLIMVFFVREGSNMYGDSWFQLEGAGWHPFRHPLEGILHAIYFVQYILQHKQVWRFLVEE